MNILIKELETRFNGYNNVIEIETPPEKTVNMEKVKDILYSIIGNNRAEIDDAHPETRRMIFSWIDYIETALIQTGNDWQTPKGKFTKRLMRHIPMLSAYAGTIGEQITRNAYNPNPEKYLISISDEIFWSDGNFGKYGSCWWGSYGKSRRVFIEDANGIALLLHDTNDPYNGTGRLWIAPIRDNYEDCLFGFNQYGNNNHKPIRIEQSASILAQILPDTVWHHGYIENDNSNDIPYINGGNGIFVAPNTTQKTDGYNFSVQWGEPDDDGYYCDQCGDYIEDEDDVYNYRGNVYCQSCFDENYKICSNCSETIPNCSSYYSETDDNYYCEECYTELYFTCDECGNETSRDDLYNANWSDYCEDCFNSLFVTCERCSDVISIDDANEYNGFNYCDDCLAEIEDEDEPTVQIIMEF